MPDLPCRGGGVNPTSMAQNDTHVALIILTTQMWGAGGGLLVEKTFSGQNLCSCAFGANIRSYTKQRARHGTPFLQTPPPLLRRASMSAPPPPPRRAIFRSPEEGAVFGERWPNTADQPTRSENHCSHETWGLPHGRKFEANVSCRSPTSPTPRLSGALYLSVLLLLMRVICVYRRWARRGALLWVSDECGRG